MGSQALLAVHKWRSLLNLSPLPALRQMKGACVLLALAPHQTTSKVTVDEAAL